MAAIAAAAAVESTLVVTLGCSGAGRTLTVAVRTVVNTAAVVAMTEVAVVPAIVHIAATVVGAVGIVVESVAIVTALESVAHTLMVVSASVVTRTEVTSVIPAATAVVMPTVSAAIYIEEMWTAIVEVVAMRVARIDTEVPVTSIPVDRTIEVRGTAEQLILPVEQDVTHIQVTVVPVCSVEVGTGVHAQQVVEVDLVCCLILILGQVQLVSHFVSQEQRLLAGLLISHCVCRYCYCEQCCQGY